MKGRALGNGVGESLLGGKDKKELLSLLCSCKLLGMLLVKLCWEEVCL